MGQFAQSLYTKTSKRSRTKYQNLLTKKNRSSKSSIASLIPFQETTATDRIELKHGKLREIHILFYPF